MFIGSAAFLWGISATLGRAVFTGRILSAANLWRPIDPLILSQTRTTFSLVLLLLILLARGGWQRIQLPLADLGRCLLLGILGVAVSNYFYYLAIQRTDVAIAIIVQYTAPVWVLLYVLATGQQRLTAKKGLAVTFAVIGIALVINLIGARGASGFHIDAYGFGAALLASFSFSFYNIAGHGILMRHDRWRVLVWALASASIFWLLFNPPWKIIHAGYAPLQWAFLFFFSMISVLGAFSLYFLGLQYLEPTRAIIASCLEPVFSIMLAALLLGEMLKPIQTLGIILVLAAIVIAQRPDQSTQDSIAIEPIE